MVGEKIGTVEHFFTNVNVAAIRILNGDFAEYAQDLFNRKFIDATPRFGKINGAFCTNWYRGKSSFILTSFNETLDDVFTLMHEIGHGIHHSFL